MKDISIKAREAVREAGKLFINTHLEQSTIIKKGFANYVTEVDYAVQEFLVPRLKAIIPDCYVISEESDQNNYDLVKPTWILDPIDGTTNFIYDYKQSAISLGLFLQGKPALGIVYNPAYDEMFTAAAGMGAYLNEVPIRASSNSRLEDSLVAFGTTPYDRTQADKTFDTVKNVFLCCRDIRRSGSAALDISYVACGRLDGYFELGIQPWDYAGGLMILKEAGGIVSDWCGNTVESLKPSSVLATNGLVHNEILRFLKHKE